MINFVFRRPLVLFLCGTLLGLIAPSESSAKKLQGKVKKKVYYSPHENFSIPVPGQTNVNDHYSDKGPLAVGGVSFSSMWGGIDGILYMETPEGFSPTPENWRLWLHQLALPGWFQRASPDSSVLGEQPARFREMDAYLALVHVPEGSTAFSPKTGRMVDSRRGLILFERSGCIYALMTETDNPVMGRPAEPPGENWPSFALGLESFYQSIEFRQ